MKILKTISASKICWSMAIALSMVSACKSEKIQPADANVTNGITSVVSNNAASLSLFGYALNTTGFNDTLSKPGPFTVICPSNQAFVNAGYLSGTSIIQATGLMNAMLPYCIVRKEVKFNLLPLAFDQPLTASNGQTLYITHWQNSRDTAVVINGNRLSASDKPAANGLLNVAEGLLMPSVYKNVQEAVSGDPSLSFFNAAIIRSGLAETLKTAGPYTVFAPVNDSFGSIGFSSVDDVYSADPAFLQALVKAHVVANRSFVYDYILKADVTTNTYTETMFSGAQSTITLIPNDNVPGRFTGIQIQGTSFNTATLSKQDVLSGNGVVHSINSILTQ